MAPQVPPEKHLGTSSPSKQPSKKSSGSLTTRQMMGYVGEAIEHLKEPHGSSFHSIQKYIQNQLGGTIVGKDTQKIAEMLRKALDSGIRGVFVYKLMNGDFKLVKMNAPGKGGRRKKGRGRRGKRRGGKGKRRGGKGKRRGGKGKRRGGKGKRRRGKGKRRRGKGKRR